MGKFLLCCGAVLIAGSSVPATASPATTEAALIDHLSGGWVDAQLRVTLANVPLSNPDSCPAADGYITSPADPGSELFNSMLLSAYLSSRRVVLTIAGCIVGRPRIIAVSILPG